MKPFCTFNTKNFMLIAIFVGSYCYAAEILETAPTTAVPVNVQVLNLVTDTLLRGLGGVEVQPVPERSAPCLLIASRQKEAGSLVVAPPVRLMTVDEEAGQDVLRELSVKFGGSGLKINDQLLLLTGELTWLNQQEGETGNLLMVKFQRGPYTGFFTGAPRMPTLVKIAQVGRELCVASF
jgi:hypothetical protein